MARAGEFRIGCGVDFADGAGCGTLSRLVVDPLARRVTHLVIEPKGDSGVGRLVPLELVSTAGDRVVLGCGRPEFEQLEEAEETHFLPADPESWGADEGQVLSWPYFGLGGAEIGWMGVGAIAAGSGSAGPRAVVYDRVPPGEVDIRRGEPVHASDGSIGHVRGVVVGPGSRVTHVLLEEGHLWGHKRVAIPISAVTSVDHGVKVNLTRDEVKELPPVDLSQL